MTAEETASEIRKILKDITDQYLGHSKLFADTIQVYNDMINHILDAIAGARAISVPLDGLVVLLIISEANDQLMKLEQDYHDERARTYGVKS